MEICVSTIVVYELEYGTLRAVDRRRGAALDRLLHAIREVPFDSQAAREAAQVRVDLEHRGLMIGPMDLLIAGTALD
jgi:tRNA(fMet)-specific endonuclease VapC